MGALALFWWKFLTMKYDWILVDADETLFSFDAFAGIAQVFAECGLVFTEQDYIDYQKVNKPLWTQYQNGEIEIEYLKQARFVELARRLDISATELNSRFTMAMAQICQPFAGVQTTIKALARRAKLGIITNGFADMQQVRLEKTGLAEYFEFVVVSEVVGEPKPNRAIFEAAFEQMGDFDKSRVLMVGDNPTSDILGGINAGIDTCWLQLGDDWQTDIEPTMVARDWFELSHVLLHQA